jgi:hypothetical protein
MIIEGRRLPADFTFVHFFFQHLEMPRSVSRMTFESWTPSGLRSGYPPLEIMKVEIERDKTREL